MATHIGKMVALITELGLDDDTIFVFISDNGSVNGTHQGLAGTGGEAKLRIQRGDVRVNGAIETRRGRQLAPGDAVEIDGRELLFMGTRPPAH